MTLDCLIVGAGIAGLTAAREMQAAGLQVLVIDKGRGVGGRMATRRLAEGAAADHGAQFITVREPEFQAMMDEWLTAGVAIEWSRGFSTGSLLPGTPSVATDFVPDGHPRYRGVPGMTAIPKFLARDLPVELSRHVESVEQSKVGWYVTASDANPIGDGTKREYDARAVLLTAPAEQSLEMLDEFTTAELSAEALEVVRSIKYEPCFSVMVQLAGPSMIPEPGAVRLDGDPIAWICDNRIKGVSGGATVVTIHAGAEYSRRRFDDRRREVGMRLVAAAEPWLSSEVVDFQVNRWKYSLPISTAEERCVVASTDPPLAFAGDGYGGPRVEGAALSGLAAADTLIELL